MKTVILMKKAKWKQKANCNFFKPEFYHVIMKGKSQSIPERKIMPYLWRRMRICMEKRESQGKDENIPDWPEERQVDGFLDNNKQQQ